MSGLAILTDVEERCLVRYLERLAEVLGRELEAIFAYGSAARGEGWPRGMRIRSDLDLLVVTRAPVASERQEALVAATYPLFLESGRQISPQFRTRAELDAPRDERFAAFLRNFRHDAVLLWPRTVGEGIATYHEGWSGPWVEDELFGTHDPVAVADALDRFCRTELGSSSAAFVFYEASVGCVAGLVLEDGRRVVVKAHQPSVPLDYLDGVHSVQATLAERGFPCPRPLVPPRPLGRGNATAEELVADGERRDGHDPAVRDELARTLARLVETAHDLVDTPGLRPGLMARQQPGSCWPIPHSRMFDFESTRRGTEWIDELAVRALELLDRSGPPVVGHADWSVKHFRFVDDTVSVVYDWDSLVLEDEPVLVGDAARSFTATWYLEVSLAPTPDEARAFVTEYERARGRSFDADERRLLAAAATYGLAYSARCESCGDPTAASFPAGGFRDTLARHGEEYLRL